MINETAAGFYAYKGLTIAVVPRDRIGCAFHERLRHMVSNHHGMYTDYRGSVSRYLNDMLAEAAPASPFTATQGRVESGHIAYICQDVLSHLASRHREVLYDQISLTYQIVGNETQDLHNWYVNDAMQDSVDRALIRKHGNSAFHAYILGLVGATTKTYNPGMPWFKRWALEIERQKKHDVNRRFETLKKVKKEAKK